MNGPGKPFNFVATWIESDNPNGFQTGRRYSIDVPSGVVMAAGMAGDSYGHWHVTTDGRLEQPPVTVDKTPYRVPSMAEIENVSSNGHVSVSTFSGCGGSCLGFRMAGFRVAWANEFIPAARNTYAANHPTTILDDHDIRLVTARDIFTATGLGFGEIDVLEGSPPCASFSTAGRREASWGKVKNYSDTKQRVDDLFFEYARLLRDLQPKMFVAENVAGLVKGVAKGYFKLIMAELKRCGYKVEARVLDAQWLGVPQTRARLIIIGVRNDLVGLPTFPTPLPYRYSVRDAIPWIGRVRPAHGPNSWENQALNENQPAPTLLTGERGSLHDHDVTDELETNLDRFAVGVEWDRILPGGHSDRYQSLTRASEYRPSPAVLATGGKSGAASVTHPYERRKFTIAELRRICAFPDDFILTGSYQQQWERLGRAVPPVMMWHVARCVSATLDQIKGIVR